MEVKTEPTPGPWKTGDCDGFIIWAEGFRSVDWIECEPGPEAVSIGSAECPPWGRQNVLDALSLDDFGKRDEWIEECRANARLMAAAPDLYEALEVVLRYPSVQAALLPEDCARANTALARCRT